MNKSISLMTCMLTFSVLYYLLAVCGDGGELKAESKVETLANALSQAFTATLLGPPLVSTPTTMFRMLYALNRLISFLILTLLLVSIAPISGPVT